MNIRVSKITNKVSKNTWIPLWLQAWTYMYMYVNKMDFMCEYIILQLCPNYNFHQKKMIKAALAS